MSINEYIVRSCLPADLPRLIELLKATGLFWEGGDSVEIFQRKLVHDPESIIVLEHAGAIIGMVLIIFDPWVSFMWHLALDRSHQGQGLGNMLADEAERRLWARGAVSVNGIVFPTNRNSRSFFKNRGYDEFAPPIMAIIKPFEK
jgi:ribosomal protein S18 acetylase RimI-like enzyme